MYNTSVWGDQLHKETRGSTTIEYIYGIDGVIGFIYNQTPYYYIKNLFGDVTKIANTQNEIVAEYLYDAWGNHTITLDTNGIGSINPIRYRGYYYDSETGLYYLKTRYYDPEIGRFISPDSTKYLDPESIHGLNLYAYCLNNPVMNVDHNGQFPGLIFSSFIVGMLFGVGLNIAEQYFQNGCSFENFDIGQAINNMLTGGALGLSFGLGIVYLGPLFGSLVAPKTLYLSSLLALGIPFTAGSLGYIIENEYNNTNYSLNDVMANGVLTSMKGSWYYMSGGLIGAGGSIGKNGKLFSQEWLTKTAIGFILKNIGNFYANIIKEQIENEDS